MPFTINLKTNGDSSEQITITCDPKITGATLRQIAAKKFGIQKDPPKLIYNFQEINDKQILENIGVESGATIYVIRKKLAKTKQENYKNNQNYIKEKGRTTKNKQPKAQVVKNPQFRRETIFANNQEANAFKAYPNNEIHPEIEKRSELMKGQEKLKTENITVQVPYQPVGQVKVYAPKEKGWTPLSVDLNMPVTNLYVMIFEHWGIDISTPITLYHNGKPLIRNGEVSLSKLGIRNGEEIHLTFDVKQEVTPTDENLQATLQTQNNPTNKNCVFVFDPTNKHIAPEMIDISLPIKDIYQHLEEEWRLEPGSLQLTNHKTTFDRNDENNLSYYNLQPGQEIYASLEVGEEVVPPPEILTNNQQNQQNSPQMINVVCLINGETDKKIVIQMGPKTTMEELDRKLRGRLGCQDLKRPFTYLFNNERINTMLIKTLDEIFVSNINPEITVQGVPEYTIQKYLANQQKQNQSFVLSGPYHKSQTYSMVPQIPPPPQPIFPPKPVTTCPPPQISLKSITQAIRKQKNPKTRLRMKRKLATLKRTRAYFAKKRAKSMFQSNNPRLPFIRKKIRYTPRKKKKHMTTREKVISRMEKNMRKRMKYKHKTRYKYKTKFKYKDLNAIRKYLIDESNAQNNLGSRNGPENDYSYNNY